MILSGTTLPLAGWLADPRDPEGSRRLRLNAIRQLVERYHLPAVELTLDLAAVFPQLFDRDFYAAVADLQQELNFVCTAHLPLLWLDPASLNQPVRRASVESLRQSIELCRPLDVRTYTLHLWGTATSQITLKLHSPLERGAVLIALLGAMTQSLAELCQLVDPRDLCVENLEYPAFDEMLPPIENAGVSICLDVGHLAYQPQNEIDFWKQHRERIRAVHLHDAGFFFEDGKAYTRDHLALGQGHINYQAFLEMLAADHYDGTVLLEVVTLPDLEESLARVQEYLRA